MVGMFLADRSKTEGPLPKKGRSETDYLPLGRFYWYLRRLVVRRDGNLNYIHRDPFSIVATLKESWRHELVPTISPEG